MAEYASPRSQPPDDRGLRYFRAVYATGSIRAAARDLETAPSAVSRQIAELERRLRTPLLERTARGVSATEAGHALARFAQKRIDLDELLVDELDQLRGLQRGQVHLASGEGFVDDVVRHGLTGFFDRHPGVRVTLTTGGTGAICERLLDDRADVALTLYAPPHRDLEVVAEAPQPLHVVCAPGHPLGQLEQIQPTALANYSAAVLPVGFGIRTLTDQLQTGHGFVLDVRFTSSSIQALRDFALAGLGFTLLPRFAVGEHLRDGSLRAVALTGIPVSDVRAQLLVRRGRTPSYAVLRLLEHLRDHVESLRTA